MLNALIIISHLPIQTKILLLNASVCYPSANLWTVFNEIFNSRDFLSLSGMYSLGGCLLMSAFPGTIEA